MKDNKLISKEELDKWSEAFKQLKTHANNIDKIIAQVKSKGEVNALKWDISEDVIEAQEVLSNWLNKAVESNKIESAKAVMKVLKVLDTASLIYFKAYTYEVMSNYYFEKLSKKDAEIMGLYSELKKVSDENKNLKVNLEL